MKVYLGEHLSPGTDEFVPVALIIAWTLDEAIHEYRASRPEHLPVLPHISEKLNWTIDQAVKEYPDLPIFDGIGIEGGIPNDLQQYRAGIWLAPSRPEIVWLLPVTYLKSRGEPADEISVGSLVMSLQAEYAKEGIEVQVIDEEVEPAQIGE